MVTQKYCWREINEFDLDDDTVVADLIGLLFFFQSHRTVSHYYFLLRLLQSTTSHLTHD